MPWSRILPVALTSQHTHYLQSDGLWLLSLGALILVAALVAGGPPRGMDGTPMASGRPNERLAWALNTAGASSAVAGSVLLLIGNFPTRWVLWVSLGSQKSGPQLRWHIISAIRRQSAAPMPRQTE